MFAVVVDSDEYPAKFFNPSISKFSNPQAREGTQEHNVSPHNAFSQDIDLE